ncbi:MAG TPA: ATP-binding protein [Longimicrobium sp.]|nr:ATP-binding protein [Longimicrobium sp.]
MPGRGRGRRWPPRWTTPRPSKPWRHIAHLFDRLWQASRNDRRGIGLGLAIVRGIVAQHRDRVGAESTPGEGSTFRLTLPAVPPRQE